MPPAHANGSALASAEARASRGAGGNVTATTPEYANVGTNCSNGTRSFAGTVGTGREAMQPHGPLEQRVSSADISTGWQQHWQCDWQAVSEQVSFAKRGGLQQVFPC